MKSRDVFSEYHPFVNFLYFALVIACSMFCMHPVCLSISLICAGWYAIVLEGKKAIGFGVKIALPMMFLAAVVNPIFNHAGRTILGYLPSGNPLTLESIFYGMAAAVLLAAVLFWFRCYNVIMTSDKFIYLFGRVIPALSLVLSMTLRLVPKFKGQFQLVREAQRGIGRDVSEGRFLQRMRNSVTILSILTTWAMENAVETADSMKARGYGLPGRTAFSIYRWENRDRNLLVWLVFCGLYVFAGMKARGMYWQYFPEMKGISLAPFPISFWIVYFLMCLTPMILDWKEDRKWRFSKFER